MAGPTVEGASNIRVLIADDHQVVRKGFVHLFANTEIEVVAEAATGEEAVKLASEHQPDVILMDVLMPGEDGLSALGRIKPKAPDVAVLMISGFDNPTYVARAAALGASGFLKKGAKRETYIEAIRKAAQGEPVWMGEDFRRYPTAIADREPAEDIPALTPREHEVLRHLANGLTNKEIAQALQISYETVKEHVQHILRKIGVSDRTQAAVWAVRKGIA